MWIQELRSGDLLVSIAFVCYLVETGRSPLPILSRSLINIIIHSYELRYLQMENRKKVGRTVYAIVGEEPSDQDVLIGVMDTTELAIEVVIAHNLRQGDNISGE